MALVARPSSVQPPSSLMSDPSFSELRSAATATTSAVNKPRHSSSSSDNVVPPTISKSAAQPNGEDGGQASGGSKFDYLVSSYEDDANVAGPSTSYGPPSASPDPHSSSSNTAGAGAGGIYGNLALDPGLTQLEDIHGLHASHANEFDLDAGHGLHFPDLPSSLLDSGPEYEYSSHTQGTVFETAQDWRGDLEANAVYGLDQYDAHHPSHYDQDAGLPAAWSAGSGGYENEAYGGQVDGYYHQELTPQEMAPRSQPAHLGVEDGSGAANGHVLMPTQHGQEDGGVGAGHQPPSVLGGPSPSKRRRDSWDAGPGGGGTSMPPSSHGITNPSGVQPQPTSHHSRSPPAPAAAPPASSNNNIFIPNGSTSNGSGSNGVTHPPQPPVGRLYPVRDAVPSQGVVNRARMPSWNEGLPPSAGPPSSAGGGNGGGSSGFAEPWHPHSNNGAGGASVSAQQLGAAASLGPPPRPTRSASYSGIEIMGAPAPHHSHHPHPGMGTHGGYGGQGMDPYASMQNSDAAAAAMYAHPSSASDAGSAYGGNSYHDGVGGGGHPYQHELHPNGLSTPYDIINAFSSSMEAAMEAEGIATCPYPRCDKTFAKNRSYNLKAHLRSHNQLKPFNCAHCPRSFSRKHDLERHARVHSGDKPYICEACGKGFPRSDALRRHWRVEKECGERAAEIEAGQPLPSLPPGASSVLAPAPIGSSLSIASMGGTGGAGGTGIGHQAALYAPYPIRGVGHGHAQSHAAWDPHEAYEGSSVGPMRGRREDY